MLVDSSSPRSTSVIDQHMQEFFLCLELIREPLDLVKLLEVGRQRDAGSRSEVGEL